MEPWKEELYHSGILGMKWGVKNGPPYPIKYQKRKALKKRRIQKSKSQKEAEQRMKKDAKNSSTLSDKDLDKKLERIKKEDELRKRTKDFVTPGKVYTLDILKKAGKTAAPIIVAGASAFIVKKVLDISVKVSV